MPIKARLDKDKKLKECAERLTNVAYAMTPFTEFDYTILANCLPVTTSGKKPHTVNQAIIMFDTETTKMYDNPCVDGKIAPVMNAVIAFTVSIRCYGINIVTLYGHTPTQLTECLNLIREHLTGDKVLFYAHNLAYDYTFCRRFFFRQWKEPVKFLATKPHYPVNVEFENGICLRDSLALAQRSLDRWAKDMEVPHQKALGKWDYDLRRTQSHEFTPDELEYIEHDTLAGVECLDYLRISLGVSTLEKYYTATGIPRRDVKRVGKENYGNKLFRRCVPTYDTYRKLEKCFHGGFTHANRSIVEETLKGRIECYDFASSYPYVMLSEKYPTSPFVKVCDATPQEILDNADDYAFIFKFSAANITLKDPYFPMPCLQKSKAIELYGFSEDNGRLLCADYYSAYITEQDLFVINELYTWDSAECTEVEYSVKDYLPRWFTDYVYELYYNKCTLKGKDPLLYALSKAKLNSLFGLCGTRSIRDDNQEDFATGEYYIKPKTEEEVKEEYEEYRQSYDNVLLFQWGAYITSYAFRNLFELGKCVGYDKGGIWAYSDTDSCYSTLWDTAKVEAYNNKCVEKMKANGYEPVVYDEKTYMLGVATFDGAYIEYRTLGAKRYCGRSVKDNELHLTLAGVPKRGVACLHDNIQEFTSGKVFDGTTTGKLGHFYQYHEMAIIDGYEVADSIDLNPCDYLLSAIDREENWLDHDIMISFFDENEV